MNRRDLLIVLGIVELDPVPVLAIPQIERRVRDAFDKVGVVQETQMGVEDLGFRLAKLGFHVPLQTRDVFSPKTQGAL